MKDVFVRVELRACKCLSCHFSKRYHVRLQVITTLPVGRKLSREVPTCGPRRLLFNGIFRFLILRRSNTGNYNFSNERVCNGVSFRQRPSKRCARMVLLVRASAILRLFFRVLHDAATGTCLSNMRISKILRFVLIVSTTKRRSVEVCVLRSILRVATVRFRNAGPLLVLNVAKLHFTRNNGNFRMNVVTELVDVICGKLLYRVTVRRTTNLIFIFRQFNTLTLRNMTSNFCDLVNVLLFTNRLVRRTNHP